MQQKWDQGTQRHKGRPLLGLGPPLVLQWTLQWPCNTLNMGLHILAILHYMQHKWDQGSLGTQRSPSLGLGPALVLQDPAMTLQYTWHVPLYIGYNFALYAKKIGIMGLSGHKGWPLLSLGPTLILQWSLPEPYNTPNMTLYILAIFLHSTWSRFWADDSKGGGGKNACATY